MRPAAIALLLALAVAPSAAQAGPNCVDRQGDMIRCGAPGAMPVGWSLPPEAARARLAARDDGPAPRQLLGLACLVGGLLALLALMPDFQGRWDRQEGEDESQQGRKRR